MISDTVKHPQMALSVVASYIFRQDRDIKKATISDWLHLRTLASSRNYEHRTARNSERSKGEFI